MSNNARETFKKNLRYYMQKNGKSQSDISRDLKVPLSTVSNWYNGTSYPRVDKMQALADYFNTSMKNLTDDQEEVVVQTFTSAQEAVKFILENPVVEAFGGYDLDSMSDEEITLFAEGIANMIRQMAQFKQGGQGD